MDWKYILSLSPDNLHDDEKDHLYSTIVWFDSDSEKLDDRKYNMLFKISQELMKHKSEQVEALLAELDEIAVRQGEEEAKKQGSLDDLTSLKSKRSQIDSDDLEQKYKNIKAKYKQQLKTLETLKFDNDKLKQSLKMADDENLHLQEEIKSIINRGDESHSDISESATDQYKELIQTIQHKNKQISQLLDDIQVVENECVNLQDKVSKLKDELVDASNQISTMTNDYSMLKIELNEKAEIISQLKEEIESQQSQIQDYVEEKQQRDHQIDEFTVSIDKRIDEWKKILEEKDYELKKLRAETKQMSLHSSKSSISSNEDKSYVEMLTKVIYERDDQLTELRMQLQEATNEMEESTALLKQLSGDKNAAVKRVNELTSLVKNLKSQLKAAHARSQELQDSIEYAEKIAESKQEDINEILNKLKDEGKIELADELEHAQKLKSQLRVKDKQITEYVKMANKLQSTLDHAVNENSALRNKLGIADDEEISMATVLLKQYKQSKGHDKLHKKIHDLEEEKLTLKSDVQKLQRKVFSLSSQLLDVNEKSSFDSITNEFNKKNYEHDKNSEQYNKLLEENEGLRKGLHEILESIQDKNERSKKEINFESLEKLLCILDARHVSGWYHPAMRLQAELNTMQGINKELREQLKNARLELSGSLKCDEFKDLEIPTNISSTTKDVITNTNKHLFSVLSSYHEQEEISSKLIQKLEEYKTSFYISEQQIKILYKEYIEQKQFWKDKEQDYSKCIESLQDDVAILNSKLIEFTNINEEEYKKIEKIAELSSNVVKLNRKCVYLENEELRLSSEVKKLKTFLATAEHNVLEKISKYKNEFDKMQVHISNLENKLELSVSSVALINVQNRLDKLTIKYRQTLQEVQILKFMYDKDTVLLHETVKSLENHKINLQQQLLKATVDLHAHEATSISNGAENISKKLAQTEISEIAEKQRANHMTNLYSLVKEQLQKSENRLQEQEKMNKEILGKNLVLQETIKTLEDQIINYIAPEIFTELKEKCITLEQKQQKLTIDNNKLKNDLALLRKSQSTDEQVNENFEVLNLKHQILDLQSTSDDKALIARLSSEVVYARLAETDAQNKIEDLSNELSKYQHDYDVSKKCLEEEKLERDKLVVVYKQQISNLKQIVYFQRELYIGSAPLISEEVLASNIQMIIKDKQQSFKCLKNMQEKEHCCTLLKEELNKRLNITELLKQNGHEAFKQIQDWNEEKNLILVKELRYQKDIEFKNMQIEQLSDRLKNQDEIIIKLEEELLRAYHIYEHLSIDHKKDTTVISEARTASEDIKPTDVKLLKEIETQTCSELITPLSENKNLSAILVNLEAKLNYSENGIKEKNVVIEQLKNKVTELEMNISLFRTQIGDKQSQITFYEKHILELQNKLKMQCESQTTNSNNIIEQSKHIEELTVLKDALKKLQDASIEKDREVLKYQTLLKRDRDEHSLAAARMQGEVKRLQDIINAQEKAYKELESTSVYHPGKAAIEQYIGQVHALENHTADLHTSVSTLNTQLQSSRQEAIRWQSLANERLNNMELLRTELEERHSNEIAVYKKDSEKWRDEICKLKELINKHRHEIHKVEPDLKSILSEKDEEIRELNSTVKKLKFEIKKSYEKLDPPVSPRTLELEKINEQLTKDCENLKKKYEITLNRERQAKEEIRSIKEQILKKPSSARSDRSDKDEKYQRRINILEKENEDLRDKLDKQAVITEAHKIAVSENYDKWKKQKFWQQSVEKLKLKLQTKTEDYDKLNQTCAGYKILIERLEREKRVLEDKIKIIRNVQPDFFSKKLDVLHAENQKLLLDNEELTEKLEMHQHHSGALGATMLEGKLEAQEKKIAILEVTSKASTEVRAEFERLQTVVEHLQKLNLRLEAENLDLKLDLEKYGNDTPRLREQIQHLESYIDVLKSENEEKHTVTEFGDHQSQKGNTKKITELERTVFVLKRVVEKLQVENKRLTTTRPCQSGRVGYDKLRMDYSKLKDQYAERLQEIMRLEEQLKSSNNTIALLEQRERSKEVNSLADELSRVKAELVHKNELLDKIKILLHRAASKEKSLLEEIATLKQIVPRDFASISSGS
ncbi:hypothetical protein RN001_004648 [Aquatica leii]|uniref:Centrosomal protein of 290kDa coiled-coil region domain-containing protein n=1 Tax=Aquatica leii TaxID=1421715 RepID=A0AAN7PYR5_9COLE|nr:hypothetical protein RN001_004648 [Aquatica leii]